MIPTRQILLSIFFITLLVPVSFPESSKPWLGSDAPKDESSENSESEENQNSSKGWLEMLQEKINELKETIKKNWKEENFESLKENIEKLQELGEKKLESIGIVPNDNMPDKKVDPSNFPIRQFKVEHPERYTMRIIEPPEEFHMHSRDQREWYRNQEGYGTRNNLKNIPKALPKNWQDFKEYFVPKNDSEKNESDK